VDGEKASSERNLAPVSALLVWSHEPLEMMREAVRSLLEQTMPPQEILVFNNSPTADISLFGPDVPVRAIGDGTNRGYVAGISSADRASSAEYLLVLNPDARLEPAGLERLVSTAERDPDTAIVGAQILLADGVRCNAGDNPLHPSGICVSGRYGEPREHGEPRDVATISGACWLIRRSAIAAAGGLVEEMFLYYDEADLCWRSRLAGLRVVFCPEAVVLHNYEFSRHKFKWFLLERNRLFCVLANYERRTLALLAPALLLTEAGLLLAAAAGGWLDSKLKSYVSLVRLWPLLRGHRRRVQALRRTSDRELLELAAQRLHSPLLPSPATTLLNALWTPYMWLVHRLL
jgi:GT2 family glycosyltransferase